MLELLVLMGFLSTEWCSQAVLMENVLLAHVYCKRVVCVNTALRVLLLLSPLYLLTWVYLGFFHSAASFLQLQDWVAEQNGGISSWLSSFSRN